MNKPSIQQREANIISQIRANNNGVVYRNAEVVGVDVENRTVELAFSSEAEVTRWGWIEVLSHDPSAVRLARINDGGALLDNHIWTAQRGVVEKAWLADDRKCRAFVRFSKSAAAEELFQDVRDKIKRHVSVGYLIHTIKLTEEREGVDVYTATDWEPYEVSIVSVPADITVGVGRSAEIVAAEIAPEETIARNADDTHAQPADTRRIEATVTGDIRSMDKDEEQQQAAADQRRAGQDAERARVRAINDMAKKYARAAGNVDELARHAIAEGHSEVDFQRAILEAVDKRAAQPLNEQAAGSDIGLTDKEVRNYSLIRVIRALLDPTDKRAQREAAFEFEASESAREKQEKKSERFVIPTDVLRRSVYGEVNTRAFNTSTAGGAAGNTGGFSIATNLMTASFIDLLRRKNTIMRMGRVLGGLEGNIDIPKQISGSTGYWVGEDEDAGETGLDLGQVSMTPKSVAAFSEITRKLLKQSSLDVEALVRLDLALGLAATLDKAGYYGTGTVHQPLGIANQDGINAVPFAGVYPTFAELVAMETAIATDDADVDSMVYVSNAGFRGNSKTTLKFAGVAGTIWESGNQVNGYNALITNQVAPGDVFHGNFGDMIIGMWGGLELHVDPFSNSKKGRLRVITFQDVDYGIRRAESFCLGRQA